MSEGGKPEEVTKPVTSALEELVRVWDRFRAGGTVACRRDGVSMALAVDAAAGAYRFVCVHCGNASPWFESGVNGVRIRSGAAAFASGSTMADE